MWRLVAAVVRSLPSLSRCVLRTLLWCGFSLGIASTTSLLPIRFWKATRLLLFRSPGGLPIGLSKPVRLFVQSGCLGTFPTVSQKPVCSISGIPRLRSMPISNPLRGRRVPIPRPILSNLEFRGIRSKIMDQWRVRS